MRYIALLRGINVGGHKKVAMSDLLALLKRLGFDDAKTLLQSGNLVFRTTGKTAAQLERQLEAAAVGEAHFEHARGAAQADFGRNEVGHKPTQYRQ